MTQTLDPTPTAPTPDAPAHPAGAHTCTGACALYSRRSVLRGAGAASLGAAALVLAACAGPSDETSGSTGDTGTADTGAGATSGSGSDGALAQLADVPVGGALSVTGPDGTPIILMQPTEGTVTALSAVCTHQGCTVAPDGDELVCPCHGSVFAMADGAVVDGPADEPLAEIAVTVVDGAVVAA